MPSMSTGGRGHEGHMSNVAATGGNQHTEPTDNKAVVGECQLTRTDPVQSAYALLNGGVQ